LVSDRSIQLLAYQISECITVLKKMQTHNGMLSGFCFISSNMKLQHRCL